MSISTFVLVPGAWHSSACWQRVVPLLEAQGQCVIAPELIGMGTDRTSLAQVELATWVNQLVNIIQQQQKTVILVGHSRGGLVISEVAERIPQKIKLLVYLTAFLVPSGETLVDNATKAEGDDYVIHHSDGTATIAPDKLVPVFYNTTSAEYAERLSSLISPEPLKIFITPLRLTDDRFGLVPRAYIECSQDKAITLAKQRAMQNRLPCKYVITMDTDHSPFMSAPAELVTCLLDLAARE